MKRFLFFGLLLSFFSKSYAQDKDYRNATIIGSVIDSAAHVPLEYATITVFRKGESKPNNGSTTLNSGHFIIKGMGEGVYSVIIECIGYKSKTIRNVSIGKKIKTVDLRTLSLHKIIQSLEAIIITGEGKVIENKLDKIVFNAEKDITSQTGFATDVLIKIPQVSIDADGNIELAGNSRVRFLINGKPSTAFGNNISNVLQSIPATQIKSIEVITNPGVKYDAQGIGGIINIILKQNTEPGINGSISLSAGTRNEIGSYNFNVRKGKLGFNAFITTNKKIPNSISTVSDRSSTDNTLASKVSFHQEGMSKSDRFGYEAGIGFDYNIREKNNINGTIAYDYLRNNSFATINQLQTITYPINQPSKIVTKNYTNNKFHYHNIDANLNYKRTFTTAGQELSLSLNSSSGAYLGTNSNDQFLLPKDSLYYGTNSENPGKQRDIELALDYLQPIHHNLLLAMGTKYSSNEIWSDATVLLYHPDIRLYKSDHYLSNSLYYDQKVYAAYSELSFPLAKSLEAKIGGRYERTQIASNYSNSQQNGSASGYNTFVPSLFLYRKIGEKQMLKFSYTKKISRPEFKDLNPFINTIDPVNITSGNPYLLPVISNRFEISYNSDIDKIGSIMINLFYRTSDHDIQSYIVYYPSLRVGDSIYKNVSMSMRQNIGMERDAGIGFFGDFHFIPKLNIRTNLSLFRQQTINGLDADYNSSGYNYRLNLNLVYQFSGTLAAEMFGNYNSTRIGLQGIYPSFSSYSFALRKQFCNKKGSLAFTTVNPFNENLHQYTELHGINFVMNSLRQIPYRSFGINLTWKFGKQDPKKTKEDNGVLVNTPPE